MDTDMLIEKFARMGVRTELAEPRARSWYLPSPDFSIDIGSDRRGEFFELTYIPNRVVDIKVTDLRPNDRHLLLQVDLPSATDNRQKYLCGHDERHWFVAAVPENAHASNVKTAKEALKPEAVRDSQARVGLKAREGRRRKNRAFIRQGEWFFIPRPDVNVDRIPVLLKEPLSRGLGSKPHWVDELVRTGGETVYVSHLHPTGLTQAEYKQWIKQNGTRRVNFTMMRRDAGVFVRGKVRHPDHKTIVLNYWHEVVMNTEHRAKAMRHVAFLD